MAKNVIRLKGKGFEFKRTKKDFDRFKKRVKKVVANEAKNHFLEGFRRGGYQTDKSSGGWSERQLQAGGRGRAILVLTGDLRRSIEIKRSSFTERAGVIVIGTTGVKYAQVHNDGGQIKITPKMRKFFWAMYYKNVKKNKKGGLRKRGNEIAEYYKNLALTKQKTINIPQREFIGASSKLVRKLTKTIEREMNSIVFPKV